MHHVSDVIMHRLLLCVQDYARHLVNSYIVPMSENIVTDTVHAMAILAGNATLRDELGRNGREMVRAMYNVSRIETHAAAMFR